jgi:RNA polymerase sigma-70 factor (ECF subfamily)
VTAANDDCTLYERWLENRDGDAFAEISRRHAPVVYDLAVRYSGDASLAEDLVQEALLDLALAGTRKPIEIGLIAWMARFAMCRARNIRSSERSRRKRQQIVGGRRREEVMPDDHLERDEELQHALSQAEPGERVVLAMRYLHGWDYGRIASALVISEGAARVRVHRALGTLRSRLGVVPAAASNGNGNGRAGNRTNGRNGKNGKAAHSSPIVGIVAAQALHQMPAGLLELGTQNAIDAAAAAATGSVAGHSGAHTAPRVGRLTLQTLGLSSAFVLVTAISLTATEPSEILTAELPSVATFLVSTQPGAADDASVGGSIDGRWRGNLPRPPRWDGGVLERLRRDGDVTPTPVTAPAEPGLTDAPEPAPQPTDDIPVERAPERPVEVPRPISRDARAATRDSVSSDDERAGFSGGGSMLSTVGSSAEMRAHTDVQPGLPADLVDPDPALSPRRVDGLVAATPLRDLPPEQAQLVAEAAELVLRVVAADGVDADGLARDRKQITRQARRLKKQYRTTRKRLRRAALDQDQAAIHYESAVAAKVRTAQHVLRLLVDVVLADGREAGDLLWPDGADVTAALEDVVSVLGTLLPDGASATEPDGSPAATTLLPDGALPRVPAGDATQLPSGVSGGE